MEMKHAIRAISIFDQAEVAITVVPISRALTTTHV